MCEMTETSEIEERAEREIESWERERMRRAGLTMDAIYGLEEISSSMREKIGEDRARDYLAAWWSENWLRQALVDFRKSGGRSGAAALSRAIDEANAPAGRERDKWISWILESFEKSVVTLVSTR